MDQIKSRKATWQTFGLLLFLLLFATISLFKNVSAQEKSTVDKPAKSPTASGADDKVADAIQAWMPSIVTVTPKGGADKKQLSHRGIVIDSRGYIVIPMLLPAKQYVVRLSNQQEVVGELILTDESLKVGLLKIEQSKPIAAVSLDKIRSARKEERVHLVPSATNNEVRSGQIISTTLSLGDENPIKLIQADIACPFAEFGSLMVSEASEPIGLLLTSRSDPQPMSVVLPLQAIQPALRAAIDMPKDGPPGRLPPSSPEIDLNKPVSITIQPASPRVKSLVELFASRGAKVLDYEEGKRLKIEAPPQVLQVLSNLMEVVLTEDIKTPEKAEVSKRLKLSLQPATPLIKSIVELYAKRGAKVLDHQEGKRLEVEGPAETMAHLSKMLEMVGCVIELINVKDERRDPETRVPETKPVEPPTSDSKMPDITGTWQVKTIEPADSKNMFFRWEIRRVQLGEVDFLVDMPWVKEPLRLPVKWSAIRHRFEGEFRDDASPEENHSFTLQPQADPNSLLFISISSNKTEGYVTQIWTRTSMTLATSYSPNDLQQPETPQTKSRTGNVVEGANRGADGTTVNDVAFQPSALPNTPAAKDLLKQLAAQESAAASAADAIRRLQANGDAVETIAPHQAQLKAHLQTAFELKMRLEELQVKELQARLSRLERQIGQRKELRDKIITRRAAELISGESLRWNPTTTAEPSSANLLNAAKEVNSRAEGIDKKAENNNTQVRYPASEEQKLRWRSAIVEIFAETKTESIDGSGVLISSSGLILSQLSDPPKNAKFLARLDDGSRFPLEVVEFPGSNLYVFQLPPNTPINHYFKLSGDLVTPSGEVYVYGSNISSPEHKLELFTAQVAMNDRQVTRWDLIQLLFWQLAKPDNYGSTASWPALNAKGELLGITLRDTGDLLLVLPVEELKKVFPKTFGEMINSPGVERREAPSMPDAMDGKASKVPAAVTRLIEPNTAIPAPQLKPGISANAQSQMLDFIRDEAYSHVEDITSLQYAFNVKDDNGWHAEAQFFADQTRFRVNRKDVAGMQVKGKSIDPLTSASAFDGVRQQYLDKNGRLQLKNGCEGASYGIGTPHMDAYSWLRRGPEDLRWDIICNQNLWKERFAEAEYFGAIPDNGRTLEIVDFPARLEGQRPCTYRVFFARELGFFPIKCLRRVSATTEISTTVTVTDFKSIEKGGQKFILPTTLTYSESRADGVSMKQQRTTTVAVDSLKVNEPIDEAVFTIDDKEVKKVFSVQDQGSIGTQSESPQPPIAIASAIYTPALGIEAIAVGLDKSAAAIKNMSVTTDYKKRHVYGLPFDAPIELILVTKTIIESEGRLRVETTGQQINIEPDGKSARAYNGRWETVFRNGEARSLNWYESNPPTASIDNTPSLHGIHPREFTTHFQSKSVSEIIRTSSAEIAERVMWDDRPVTIVQTTPIQNANDARRYRFWIDQERNVVVRRAIEIRFAEGQPWQEYARIENHDYQQVSPGIWLPSKVKYESLEVTPELTPAKLSWSYEGTNRDWKVNSELPSDTFELVFPEGTVVNDHRAPVTETRAAAADMKSLQEREMNSLQGTWCFDVLQSSAWPKPIGLPTDSSGRKSEQRWIIDGDRITWTSLDGELIDVSFTIDPTKTPKQIDFTFLSGPQKGKKSIGIYEPQKGNANYLWLCMTNPGSDAPRPTEVGYSSEKQRSMIGIYPVEKPDTTTVSESLKRFQGEWKMTLCDSTFKSFGASQEVVSKWSWVIRGDEILWSRDDDMWKLKLDVDASKNPSELDLTYMTGPFKGAKCLGMFQWGGVDKTQLMIAIQDPLSDAPRPSKFSMDTNLRTGLMILEPRSDESDRKEMQGTWEVRELIMDGEAVPEADLAKFKIVFEGDLFTLTGPEGVGTRKFKFKLDSKLTPKGIDTIPQEGPIKGKTGAAIYELREGTLKLCIPNNDFNTRPKEFKSSKGSQLGVFVLKKSKS